MVLCIILYNVLFNKWKSYIDQGNNRVNITFHLAKITPYSIPKQTQPIRELHSYQMTYTI